MRSVLLLLSLSLWALLPTRAQNAQQPKAAARIYFDQAHGEAPPPAPMADIGRRLGYTLDLVRAAATTEFLRGSQLVYFRAPNGTFTESEKAAIVAHVNSGGSLLLVLDEEKRQSLAKMKGNKETAGAAEDQRRKMLAFWSLDGTVHHS